MHELSIAVNIIEICDSYITDKNVKVKEIELEIGKLSGVVVEALETALEQVVKNTIYRDAEMNISIVEAIGKCIHCGHEFAAEDYYDQCPNCSNYGIELLKGNEMKVKSIELF